MQNQPNREVQCEGLLQALPPEMEPICDSRGEVKDKIFVCIKGGRHDGHTDAAGVLRRGAAAIVTQKKLGLPREYTVPDTRAALARLCARYWGEPAKELRIIGITGTNGKTTTAHLLCHLLQSAGIKTGRIGTDGIAWGEKTQPNPYTTPPPTELHRILHQMVEDGITTVVMEVSSQALEQRRVEGITFAAAVFTNLSPEHLDYHGDMERYFASKAKIFSQCRCAVINTADPYGRRLLDRANVPISGYHLPWQYRCEPGRSILPWRGGQLIVPLTGEVFLPDALAAAETALVLGRFPCDGRRIFVAADMLELGDIAEESHREIGALCVQEGIDLLLTWGPLAQYATRAAKAAGMEAHHFEEKEALTKYLTATAHRGDVIWCKASHGMALEEVIAAFYRDYHA